MKSKFPVEPWGSVRELRKFMQFTSDMKNHSQKFLTLILFFKIIRIGYNCIFPMKYKIINVLLKNIFFIIVQKLYYSLYAMVLILESLSPQVVSYPWPKTGVSPMEGCPKSKHGWDKTSKPSVLITSLVILFVWSLALSWSRQNPLLLTNADCFWSKSAKTLFLQLSLQPC